MKVEAIKLCEEGKADKVEVKSMDAVDEKS